jgi:hypothetical protein
MSSILNLEPIKERADKSINCAAFDGDDEAYEHAVAYILDHRALITEVERLRTENDELQLSLLAEQGKGGGPEGWVFEPYNQEHGTRWRRGQIVVRRSAYCTEWELLWRYQTGIHGVYATHDVCRFVGPEPRPARELMLLANQWLSEHPEVIS